MGCGTTAVLSSSGGSLFPLLFPTLAPPCPPASPPPLRSLQPLICSNTACSNRERWALERDDCVFADWQRARLQENADEVPPGSLPRSLDVILRNELVEQARAGDK